VTIVDFVELDPKIEYELKKYELKNKNKI